MASAALLFAPPLCYPNSWGKKWDRQSWIFAMPCAVPSTFPCICPSVWV